MAKGNGDGYLEEIQERMDGEVFRAMLEVMARRVMEEELALHLGAERHERTPGRKGHRNGALSTGTENVTRSIQKRSSKSVFLTPKHQV